MLGFETLTACTSSSGVLSSVLGSLPAIAAAPVTLGSLLGAGLYDGRLFDKDIWVNLMFALRVTLCLGGALLLLAEVRARRMNIHIRERTRKRIALIMTVLAFGAYFDFGNEKVRYSEYYHRHELYHYYLGSKYSEELGYKMLYSCTMVAEVQNGRKSQIVDREFRDLTVNLIKQAKDTWVLTEPERCTERFTPERWEDFKKDIDWFYKSAAGSYWERMQQDHGYNPPPVWTMTGKALASLHPADDGFFKFLASLDVLMQAGMIVLLYWAFGFRVGALGAIFWGCNAAANFYWTGGAFLRQDWIFLLVASVALARKRFFFWAGFALMWSSLLRVFPAALFGGWAAMTLLYAVQRMRGRDKAPGDRATGLLSYLHPTHRRLIGGAVAALALLVPASMATTGGTQAYKEFADHIQTHKATPLTNHMGLPTILSHTWEGRMRFTRNENLDDAFEYWKKGRNDRKAQMRPVQMAIFLGFFLWIAWAVKSTRLVWVGPALSLPLVMCLTDLTCYYYCMYIVAAVLLAMRRPIGVALLATGASSVILLGKSIGYADLSFSGFYYVDDNFTAQSYVFLVFSILMLWAYSRPISMQALSRWWNPKLRRVPARAAEQAQPEEDEPAAEDDDSRAASTSSLQPARSS